ncbi:hypothetical protein [uncultured Pelagimonas sp.]|uniref:hypothetical protein n=1 Tax=uncultured Pelagimonas sp. TaxID=1618102 RepID=UPI00262F346D|nr:hypothetical protein [uncultured Pelagimonas sp.]
MITRVIKAANVSTSQIAAVFHPLGAGPKWDSPMATRHQTSELWAFMIEFSGKSSAFPLFLGLFRMNKLTIAPVLVAWTKH